MHALEKYTKNQSELLLTSLLKLFAIFMVKFYHKQTGAGPYLLGLSMKCVNWKPNIYWKMEKIHNKDSSPVFITAIIFHHVGF